MTELQSKKLENGREYRSMRMDVAEADDYVVEGYATTFDEPYHLYYDQKGREVKEEVSRDAFANADMSDVIMQYDHEGRVFARLSNNTLELNTDEHGLKVRAYLGGTEIGRNLYEEIKGGYTNKMSFGFTVAKDKVNKDGDGFLRTISAVGKLYDVSAVSLPANDLTEISARNHCDGAIAEIDEEIHRLEEEQRIKAEKKEILMAKLNALKGEKNGN
jgi:HK97 family phage prohead protease